MYKKNILFLVLLFTSFCAFASEDAAGPADAYECTICQNAARFRDVDGQFVQTPCGHIFHRHCIVTWFRNHNTCPICRRQNLTVDNLTPVDRARPQAPAVHDEALARELAQVRGELERKSLRLVRADLQIFTDAINLACGRRRIVRLAGSLGRVTNEFRAVRQAIINLQLEGDQSVRIFADELNLRRPCFLSMTGGMCGGMLAGLFAENVTHNSAAPLAPFVIGLVGSIVMYKQYEDEEERYGRSRSPFIQMRFYLPSLIQKRQNYSFGAGFTLGSLASFFFN